MNRHNSMAGRDDLYERLRALQNDFYGSSPPVPPSDPDAPPCEPAEEEELLPPDIQERLDRLRKQPTEEMNIDDEEIPDEPDQLTSP